MNAHPEIPELVTELELPGLDEVLRAEIGIVGEDVERLETRFATTCGRLAGVNAEIAAMKLRFSALKKQQDELTVQSATEKRLLTQRRRVLFEMREEIR